MRALDTEGRIRLTQKALEQYFSTEEATNITEYLWGLGFFTSPASTRHHGDFEGGLFEHSYRMYEILQSNPMEWDNPRSPLIIALFHDLCKCDAYTKNADGTYSHNKNNFPLGHHGLASVVIAQQILKLTREEILCIRWHMGAYETDAWGEYDKAIKLKNNVLYVHNADMHVSKILGV